MNQEVDRQLPLDCGGPRCWDTMKPLREKETFGWIGCICFLEDNDSESVMWCVISYCIARYSPNWKGSSGSIDLTVRARERVRAHGAARAVCLSSQPSARNSLVLCVTRRLSLSAQFDSINGGECQIMKQSRPLSAEASALRYGRVLVERLLAAFFFFINHGRSAIITYVSRATLSKL